jgi:hypothetical protein
VKSACKKWSPCPASILDGFRCTPEVDLEVPDGIHLIREHSIRRKTATAEQIATCDSYLGFLPVRLV